MAFDFLMWKWHLKKRKRGGKRGEIQKKEKGREMEGMNEAERLLSMSQPSDCFSEIISHLEICFVVTYCFWT